MIEKPVQTTGRVFALPRPVRVVSWMVAGVWALLALWLGVGALPVSAEEPRPTPTPATVILLHPDNGLPHTLVEVEGYGFPAGSRVTLTWDETITLTTKVRVGGDGSFRAQFEAPEDSRGHHVVRATANDPLKTYAEAVFRLIIPTRTPTPTPTITPTPTFTWTPTWTPVPTNTPAPTNTPLPTNTPRPPATPTMKPTLRPVTPIYPTPTPYPAPPTPTPYVPPPTPTPYVPPSPTATSTLMPIPTPPLPSPTVATVVPSVTGTASPTGTVVVPSPTGTAPPTVTVVVPSPTSTASPTVWGAVVTPVATPTLRPTPSGDLAATGGGGYFLLWGGTLLLVVSMVAARWLRSIPST